MSIQLYHNPRCSKSRQAKELLDDRNITYETVLYLKDVPSKSEIKSIVQKLQISANELIRKKDEFYKTNYSKLTLSEKEAIDLLHSHPELIERPILVMEKSAAIGRPLSNIEEIL